LTSERDSAPIILVPGFWLGAWAWDEVVSLLRADGYHATALTLPGLESVDADRSNVSLEDHVAAIIDAVEAAPSKPVLAVHSGTGFSGYAASDRIPEKIAAMVYVDSAPGKGAMDAEFADAEKPLLTDKELAANENLDGLSEAQLATFRERAVPQPGRVLRDSIELTNDARLDVPSTVICTGFTAEDYRKYAQEGSEWLAGLLEIRDVTYVDLPTSHWPMWSRPDDLAKIIGDVADSAGDVRA
jgi:pimeloyl-ACP methyl ester carboxylesterase